MSFRKHPLLPGAPCSPEHEVLVIFEHPDIRFLSQVRNAIVRYVMGVQVFDAGEVLQAIEPLTGGKQMYWQVEQTGINLNEKQSRRWE